MRSPNAAPPLQEHEEGVHPHTRNIINAMGVRAFFLSTDPKCAGQHSPAALHQLSWMTGLV